MIHPIAAPGQTPTGPQMQIVVERKLREIRTATTSLLQEISGADPREVEMMRAEAARLNEVGFTLTRLLCFDNIETAYGIVNGDLDECGEVLGLTA